MKFGIFSDVHANLPALHAVLRDAEAQGCTNLACLGDIVGDGSRPKECLDLIRGLGIPCVRGNLDFYCSTDVPLTGFNDKALAALQTTRNALTDEDRTWLRSLPLVLEMSGFVLTHATLAQPERWAYVFDKQAAANSFAAQKAAVCFFGHTHVPVAFIRDTVVRGGTYSKFSVQEGRQYFINVGSVGQPRDNDARAAYSTYDLSSASIELRRVEFEDEGPAASPAVVVQS